MQLLQGAEQDGKGRFDREKPSLPAALGFSRTLEISNVAAGPCSAQRGHSGDEKARPKHAHVGCRVRAENMQMWQQMLQGFSFLPCPTVISSAIGKAQLTLSPRSSAIPSAVEE